MCGSSIVKYVKNRSNSRIAGRAKFYFLFFLETERTEDGEQHALPRSVVPVVLAGVVAVMPVCASQRWTGRRREARRPRAAVEPVRARSEVAPRGPCAPYPNPRAESRGLSRFPAFARYKVLPTCPPKSPGTYSGRLGRLGRRARRVQKTACSRRKSCSAPTLSCPEHRTPALPLQR